MSKADDLKSYRTGIEAAKKVRDKWWNGSPTGPGVVSYCKAYNGSFPVQWEFEDIQSNWIRRGVDAYLEHMFWRAPSVDVPIKKGVDAYVANAASSMLNWVIRNTSLDHKFQLALRDALLCGSGWIKVGYHAENIDQHELDLLSTDPFAENDAFLMNKGTEALEGEDHDQHIAVHQALLDDPEIMVNLTKAYGREAVLRIVAHIEEHRTLKEAAKKRGRVNWRQESEEVWIERVDPRDVLIDPDASCMEDAEWVAFRMVRDLDDLKNDPALRYTRDLEGGAVEEHIGNTSDEMLSQVVKMLDAGVDARPEQQDVELWEVWDRRRFRRLVICDQIEKFLVDEETPFPRMPGFFPFVQVRIAQAAPTDVESDAVAAYGMSVVSGIWGEQLQLNRMKNLQLQIAKCSVPKNLFDPSLPQEVLTQLADAAVGGYVSAKGLQPGTPMQSAFAKVGGVESTMDILQAIKGLTDEIQFKLGLSEVLIGFPSAGGNSKTATESQIKMNSSSAILDNVLNKINGHFLRLCRMMHSLIVHFYSKERVISVAGKEGESWQLVSGQEVLGKVNAMDVVIRTGSQSSSMDALKRQQALATYQLLAQDPIIKRKELLLWTLSEMGVPRDMPFVKTDEEIAAEQAQLAQQQQMLLAAKLGFPLAAEVKSGHGLPSSSLNAPSTTPPTPDSVGDMVASMYGGMQGQAPSGAPGAPVSPPGQ